MLSTFAGGRLFGRRFGSERPRILALHGWGRTHRDWHEVLEGFDAIALDLPGFGASPAPDEPWGLEDYARSVEPVLDEMTSPVVLVGHSHGGSVAVRVAAAAGPDRVAAVVVSGSPLIRRRSSAKPPLSFRLARWLHARRLLSTAKMEELRRARGSADYRAATGVMRDTLVRLVNEDVADALPGLGMSFELVWGEDDREVPVDVARDAAALVPQSNLHRIPGVGHDTPAEAPAALRRVLSELMDGARSKGDGR